MAVVMLDAGNVLAAAKAALDGEPEPNARHSGWQPIETKLREIEAAAERALAAPCDGRIGLSMAEIRLIEASLPK